MADIDPMVTAAPHIEDDALMERSDAPRERRIDIRLVRWGEVAERTQEGYRERFARGAFAGIDPSTVILESQAHKGTVVGVAESLEEREDGAYATFRVVPTPAGDELLALTSPGPNGEPPVLRSASVAFRPGRSRHVAGGVIERVTAGLERVAIIPRGAYPSAQILAVREEPAQEIVMADVVAEPEAPAPITPEPIAAPESPQEDAVPPTPELVERAAPDLTPITSRIDGLVERMASVDQRMAVIESLPSTDSRTAPELYAIPSLVDFLQRAESDETIRTAMSEYLVERTVADEVTTDNAGVLPPSWLTDIKRIVNRGRPIINAFGGPTPLPATGTEIDWPYLNTNNTLMAVQASEKTEVQSAKVSFAKGSASVVTYAGYADISYQLAQRSSPPYREARNRVMLAFWAKLTDTAFATSLYSGGVAATYGWDADTTGQNLKEALFAASVQVEIATGLPAEFAIAATDIFQQLARLSQIVPPTPTGNPSNASGTAHAGTLEVNVSGLPIIHGYGLGTGQMIVSNRTAATWFEEGPRNVTSEDVAKLGTNDAWYSFAAPAIFVPAGIVKLFGPGASGS